MITCLANETSHTGLQAQYLVCDHLVRACQQALYEIAVDSEDDPKVRQRAVKILKEIRTDWILARRSLRKELANAREAYARA